ncbi:MAG: sulfatase-modifying factor protein [Armatimonadetes bacterium 55-13]|nr:SUMF1/EgtB/PvdO family nonheme iron enzyme [Armatimonadota bacterium]OJU63702.1 MAG: sulfatase-modifying factor protein [Armatimonadetes bacterium 55-13]
MIFSSLCLLLYAPIGFVTIPAGTYSVGKAGRLEYPPRKVKLASYQIAKTETTNAEFALFVQATGYVTDAERYRNAMIFVPPMPEFRWNPDETANWRYPNGVERGGITQKADHPVTCISFHDALEYCKWAGVRLPTLDEWEVACRAGTTTDYFFGTDRNKVGKYANIWHGRDHTKPDTSDGYMYTSPVGRFKPSPNGLYDIYGNVFEFCTGRLPGDRSKRIVHARGGSWWCSKNSCCFFNSFDIGNVDMRASFSNQGFRVVRDTTNR